MDARRRLVDGTDDSPAARSSPSGTCWVALGQNLQVLLVLGALQSRRRHLAYRRLLLEQLRQRAAVRDEAEGVSDQVGLQQRVRLLKHPHDALAPRPDVKDLLAPLCIVTRCCRLEHTRKLLLQEAQGIGDLQRRSGMRQRACHRYAERNAVEFDREVGHRGVCRPVGQLHLRLVQLGAKGAREHLHTERLADERRAACVVLLVHASRVRAQRGQYVNPAACLDLRLQQERHVSADKRGYEHVILGAEAQRPLRGEHDGAAVRPEGGRLINSTSVVCVSRLVL
mmetsp:Transcript_66438/g.182245  ORF Transcript_66438/g.182245 Transcript_66438/m.182245 type:complete len:283 (+) Transcript_66438:281-1129(+)